MRRPGPMAGWVLLALVGLVIAAGAAYAASRVATQPIGLSSEPISAGRDLAPARTARPVRTPTPGSTPASTPTATPDVTASGDDSGGDDSGGPGRGRGRGRGGDDDGEDD